MKYCILIFYILYSSWSFAQQNAPSNDEPQVKGQSAKEQAAKEEPTRQRQRTYTYGFKMDVPNLSQPGQGIKLRPVLGFTYGKWRIGTNSDPDSVLGFTSFRREPTVGYEAQRNEKVRILLGLRIQNMTTGEGLDLFESGRHTLRGRLQAHYKLAPYWSLGSELTQDLLNKGDGTTLTLGATKQFEMSGRQSLNLGFGLTWANAKHWQTPYLSQPKFAAQAEQLRSGFGSVGVGITYRRELTQNLIWSGSLSAGQSVGQLQDFNGSRVNFGMQTGLSWYGKW